MSERTYSDHCRKSDVVIGAAIKWIAVLMAGLGVFGVISASEVVQRIGCLAVSALWCWMAFEGDRASRNAKANRERLGL